MFREGAPTRWEGRQVGVREGGGFESWGAKSWFLGWGIFAISPLSIVRLFGIVGGVGNECRHLIEGVSNEGMHR